ncbi:MAG: iron-containing alcohol dehydrogenase, partial [Spirochaetales bacterium]|nr:iron-containing alcohol dehydrogenase [Spirochaetales bacterium]
FNKVLPIVAIPTTAGTGSEVTPYSILTNNKLQTKSNLNSGQLFPQIAYLDGKYTKDLPYHITAATAADALSHSAEAYLAVRAIPLGQSLALESLSIMGPILPKLAKEKTLTIEERGALLYASTLAGIVIAQSGTTAVHAMGYSLTYFKDIDHGKANGMLMSEYFRFVGKERPDEVAKVLSALGFDSVDAFEKVMEDLLGKEKLSSEEASKFASIAIKAGNIANTTPAPSEEDLNYILSTCFVE